ncbi:acyl-CoA dehydrogenase family protein [Acinetobacter sp. XS-4]|uniref:acyl-CoA dehydrogenase family protein n=1 Tax=Acinetobacter sp. XS-4 TaxID=2923375 RepID=UPI00208FB9E3|nr:acyl-CoA dehydrogenase family protein [Acinetobacter sp. XS-4]USP42230.1 acyl-CoA/acyl-ACP dehydrogenase [Acinetobacter sp. XS-4]
MNISKIEKNLSYSFKKALEIINKEIIPVLKSESKVVHEKSIFPHQTFSKLKEKKLLTTIINLKDNPYQFNLYDQFYFIYILSKECASTGMIYAMHITQLYAIINDKCNENLLYNIFKEQSLIASATSEIGKGGDISRSITKIVKNKNNLFFLNKKCPVISYADYADAILLTANDYNNKQVFIYLTKEKYTLELLSLWNSMGLRGTCSNGYDLSTEFNESDILLCSSNKIINEIILPYSHLLWSGCWLGIASNAFDKTLKHYKINEENGIKVAEIYNDLLLMENSIITNLISFSNDYCEGFTKKLEITSMKPQISELCIDICLNCLKVLGIIGYTNNSEYSITKNISDSLSSLVMINNNRINNNISELLKIVKL